MQVADFRWVSGKVFAAVICDLPGNWAGWAMHRGKIFRAHLSVNRRSVRGHGGLHRASPRSNMEIPGEIMVGKSHEKRYKALALRRGEWRQ